ARRGADGSWIPALSPEELIQAVHDNLRNLGLDVLDVVNFRSLLGAGTGSHGPAEGSIEAPLTVLAELRHKGLVRRIGLSNVACADRRRATHLRDRLRAESLQSGASRRRCFDRRSG